MGSIGFFYSILQAHLTNAWLDHRLKLRIALYGLSGSLPVIALLFHDQLWARIFIVSVLVTANTIFLPLVYGFLKLEQLSPEQAEVMRRTRALTRIDKREARDKSKED